MSHVMKIYSQNWDHMHIVPPVQVCKFYGATLYSRLESASPCLSLLMDSGPSHTES